MSRYFAPATALSLLMLLAFATVVSAESRVDWTKIPEPWSKPEFVYEACHTTGGHMPVFFNSVVIEVTAQAVTFHTDTVGHGIISLPYYPDGLVRRGTDYHFLEDGTVLADMPAHEASYWEGESLVREEVTYLPDNTYVLETNTISINSEGALTYELHVDGALQLSAVCA